MRIMFSAVASVLAAILLVSAVSATENGSVSGTVTAKGLRTSADIVVSLEAPGLKAVPPPAPIQVDQKGMVFIPHVLPVVRGTTVRFLNSDALPHNVFSPEGKYNLGTWPQGETKDRTFEKPGAYTQLCRVHTEMEGYVVVLDTPYFATTDKTGAFEIKNVAPGQYTLVAWSEKLKTAKQAVTVEPGRPVTLNLTLAR